MLFVAARGCEVALIFLSLHSICRPAIYSSACLQLMAIPVDTVGFNLSLFFISTGEHHLGGHSRIGYAALCHIPYVCTTQSADSHSMPCDEIKAKAKLNAQCALHIN